MGIQAELSGRNDIAHQGRKFSGNSFYQSRRRSFHNGTLLIDVDMAKLGRYLSPLSGKLQSKGVASVRVPGGESARAVPRV
ncbi:MAG: biotin/lipoate A/B protein ligase family protein [Dysosmobacter sp.]